MIFRLTVVILFALIGVGSTLWLNHIIETRLGTQPVISSDSLPDYYMRHFVINGTDLKGRPKFMLQAELMNHYPYDDHSDLIKPKLKLYAKSGPPWFVTSQTGRITSGGKLVVLYGVVHITKKAGKLTRAMSIITRDITFSPETNNVTTVNPVSYTSGHSQLNGIGMNAFLNENRIILKSNVEGLHVPGK